MIAGLDQLFRPRPLPHFVPQHEGGLGLKSWGVAGMVQVSGRGGVVVGSGEGW